MTTHAEATAAPVPFPLGGKEFRMSPLTDIEIGELDNWLRARMVRAARESLTPDMTAEERDETLQAAVRASAGVTFLSDICTEVVSTPDGLARLIWHGIHNNHPGVSVQDVMKLLIDDINGAEESLMAFDIVNNSPREKKKKARRRGKRRR